MHHVEKPELQPGVCAVTGRSEDQDGFVDTGNNLPQFEPRVYISLTACRDLGRVAGMVEGQDHEGLKAELTDAESRIELLESELDQAQKALDAVEVLRAHTDRRQPQEA